jgi:hypothetical protein
MLDGNMTVRKISGTLLNALNPSRLDGNMTTVRRISATLLIYVLVTVSAGIQLPFGGSNFVRGEAATVCGELDDAETTIQRYLASTNVASARAFHVQGWRWHTMSLIREARRLHHLAVQLQDNCHVQNIDAFASLQIVAEYTVGFNMKGLHRVEKDLFFPWVRTKTKSIQEKDVVRAFDDVLDQLEKDRQRNEMLGASLVRTVDIFSSNETMSPVLPVLLTYLSLAQPLQMEKAALASDSSISQDARSRAVGDVAANAAAIAESTNSMLEREEAIVVPAIATLVPEAEQKSFNNQVIRKLGIFDSRLHLVGMHEAVADNQTERQLFQETIPSIPQMMIPRWKRTMYEPRAGALDKVMSQ